MYRSLAIYLAIGLLFVVVVNTQRTTDSWYSEGFGSDQQSNKAQKTLQRCQLSRQQLQTQLTELQNKYENISQVLNAVLLQQEHDNEKDTSENSLNATSFLDNIHLVDVIPTPVSEEEQGTEGVTVLGSQLFVTRDTHVDVYDTNNLTLTRNITITGSNGLWAIVASLRHNCLYISDTGLGVIYKYNLSDNVVSNWSVGALCYGLSLTNTHNVLATRWNYAKLTEYSTDGTLIREIILDSSIDYSYHSIQLSSGQFLVSHGGGESWQRVCLLTTNGSIILCYGGPTGSLVGQLYYPGKMAVDKYENVLVTDSLNQRIVLLSPSLTHLGYISIARYPQIYSQALHLDLSTRRLYIGEGSSNSGRIFVLSV